MWLYRENSVWISIGKVWGGGYFDVSNWSGNIFVGLRENNSIHWTETRFCISCNPPELPSLQTENISKTKNISQTRKLNSWSWDVHMCLEPSNLPYKTPLFSWHCCIWWGVSHGTIFLCDSSGHSQAFRWSGLRLTRPLSQLRHSSVQTAELNISNKFRF